MHSNSTTTSTKRQRIAELAKQKPEMAFTSLNHLLDLDLLREAFCRTPKDKAPGVDGQTWADYEANLEENLQSLLRRAKSGTYRAPPVRRVHVPKGTGNETRPIGIPTLEDKVLQRAVVMLLEPLYEPLFHKGSYGFRPGRSAHQALESLWEQLMATSGGWILDVDIRKFFDTLDHGHLRDLLRHRVRDGVLLRLIGKWLKAGVLEDGQIIHPEEGTPQGGVISPLLANIYLHYVLDEWLEQEVKPRLRGRAFLIRYADDFVLGFTGEADARRLLEVLPRRFARYGLTIHPDKTHLLRFRPGPCGRSGATPERDRSFDFLGFTHYWGRSRKGRWVVKRKTATSRLTRAIMKISEWCRRHRHEKIKKQHATLSSKLRGHFNYYGITGNSDALSAFRHFATRVWKKWLSRRNRERRWTWKKHCRMLKRYPLPPATVVHSVCRT
jgi:group II intron reverse transcriptase/maturase